MSAQKVATEIERILIGFEVQEAVDAVVEYVIKHKKDRNTKQGAFGYWTGLSDDQKVDVLKKAIEWKLRKK